MGLLLRGKIKTRRILSHGRMWLCLNVIWHSLLLMGWVSALLPPKQHIRVCLGRLGGDLSSLSSSQIPFSEDGLLPEVKKRSRKQEISRKWPRKRKNPRSSSSRGTDFSFLKSLESTGDIVDFIRNQDASAQVFRSWSSYDETSFIRLLRDRRAYREIIEFMSVARKNVYVYTAAISSLASSDDYKKECFRLLGG